MDMGDSKDKEGSGKLSRSSSVCSAELTARERLLEMMSHVDKRADFKPSAHLYIISEKAVVNGDLNLLKTDLAHSCLYNYFSPHGHISVSWVQRETMRKGMLSRVVGRHTGSMADTARRVFKLTQDMEHTAAILFLSSDAISYKDVHETTFLNTLAVILQTSRDHILEVDIHPLPLQIIL